MTVTDCHSQTQQYVQQQYVPISQPEEGVSPKFCSALPTRKAFQKKAADIILQNTKEPTAEESANGKILLKWLRSLYGAHFSFVLFPDVIVGKGDGIASPRLCQQAWRVQFNRKPKAPIVGHSRQGQKLYALSEEEFMTALEVAVGAKRTISGLKVPR